MAVPRHDADTDSIEQANTPEPAMNAAKSLVLAVASVAAAAAIGMALADAGANRAQAKQEIVKLDRVVIIGKRAQAQASAVVQLPRVVIEGHRMAHTQLAQASAKTAVKAG